MIVCFDRNQRPSKMVTFCIFLGWNSPNFNLPSCSIFAFLQMEFAKLLHLFLLSFSIAAGEIHQTFYFCFTYVSEVLRVVLAKPLYFFMLSFCIY
jgi:hypothetical protein